MKHIWRRLAVVVLVLTPAVAGPPARDLGDYVRLVHFRKNREDPGVWIGQTSVREFRNPETGATVVLLALVHSAGRGYYESLQPHIRDADAVLAEGTGGELGKSTLKDEELPPNLGWFRRYKSVSARLLDLVSQSDWEAGLVDKRWVLADMGRDEVLKFVREGALSFPVELEAVVKRWEAAAVDSAAPEALARARTEAWAYELQTFYKSTTMDEPTRRLHDARENVLRNALRENIPLGKSRRIAVIYGAWHMPPIEATLKELGFEVEATCWHDCIACKSESDEKR